MRMYTFPSDTSQSTKDHRIVSEISRGVPIRDLNPVQVTTGVLERLAADASGFRLIPEEYLTDELIATGMGHFRARQADIHASPDYRENYRLASLSRLASGQYSLAAFNYDLIDKRMLLQAISASNIGVDECLKKIRPSEFDDEVALASIEHGKQAIFAEHVRHTFKISTWIAAISKSERYWQMLNNKACRPILKELISQGFWPSRLVGSKPQTLIDAVILMEPYTLITMKDRAYLSFIESFPMDQVLPLLKSKSREYLLESIYSMEELRPHMKQFPFLKAVVLEAALGL